MLTRPQTLFYHEPPFTDQGAIMLINFQFRNFGSFWKPAIFSMVASSVRRHPSHVAEIGKRDVLRSAFVFGANAGGKTNFVKAIGFARQIVEEGLDGVSCDRKHFRLAPGKPEDVGVFQFTICANDKFYEYGLAISYSNASIVSEWLSLLDDSNGTKAVFSADWSGKKPAIDTDFELAEEDKLRFEVYKTDACNMPQRKRTFLVEIAEKGVRRTSGDFFQHFANVYFWFRRLIVIYPDTTFGGMIRYVIDESARLSFGTLLKHFDTGIEKLSTQKIDAEKVLADLPADRRRLLKARIISDLTRNRSSVAQMTTHDNAYLVHYRDGQLLMEKVVADHGCKDEPFDRADESDGTRRLYDLLPLQGMFPNDTVAVIDELDRSLHTKATTEFIRTFFERADGHRSQLIATTHDASVLDLDLLRQDEIWFVERGDDHASTIYPLTKFKARFDKDIHKDYLLGRYGALPIFGKMKKTAHRER